LVLQRFYDLELVLGIDARKHRHVPNGSVELLVWHGFELGAGDSPGHW
jgi:hypothetical protein